MGGTVDDEERDILARFERGGLVARPDTEQEMASAREAARNTSNKIRRVNLPVTERDCDFSSRARKSSRPRRCRA